jgi:SAM-dependent methyltransferase
MRLFPHDELRYYSFGLRAGLANLFTNGLTLGLRKTAGKIAQPINAASRFPEYFWFERAIRRALTDLPSARRISVLDVGSPKLIGLYLAHTTQADLTLSDITALNVDEYRAMWRALRPTARGSAQFVLQDARRLGFRAGQFDVVYAMSVIEHITGDAGDATALAEMIRVLRPGGLLVVSVPLGERYEEQHRVGFAGAARETGDREVYFFQRIYDAQAVRTRLLAATGDLERLDITTVSRRRPWMGRIFGSLGDNARGALGFLNPLLSIATNRSTSGLDGTIASQYGPCHSARDIYGDVILSGWKR